MARRHSRSLGFLAALLLWFATLATIAAAADRWLDRQTLHTQTWTDTSSRLIADRHVRDAIAGYAVRGTLARAGAIGAIPGLRSTATTTTERFLASPPGRIAWRAANRNAQTSLLAAVDAPKRERRSVTLDLTAVSAATLTRLARLPGASALAGAAAPTVRLTILTPGQVDDVRPVVSDVRTLAWALPLAALVGFLLALLLTRGSRAIALSRIGYAIAIAGGLVLLGRWIARDPLADAFVNTGIDRAAVKSAWMIATSQLRDEGVELVIAGAAVAVVSWLARGLGRAAGR